MPQPLGHSPVGTCTDQTEQSWWSKKVDLILLLAAFILGAVVGFGVRERSGNMLDLSAISDMQPAPGWEQLDPPVTAVLAAAAAAFQVPRRDIISQRRDKTITRIRHIVMWIARKRTARSYPEIGRLLGDRDHTTVINAVRNIELLLHAGNRPVAIGIQAVEFELKKMGH